MNYLGENMCGSKFLKNFSLSLPGEVSLYEMGKWGDNSRNTSIIRLISSEPLRISESAQAVKIALNYTHSFDAKFLVTPGGFTIVKTPFYEKEPLFCSQISDGVDAFIKALPGERNVDIILGIDSEDGHYQESYLIPNNACTCVDCFRAWKAYPTIYEPYVVTKGVSCPTRTNKINGETTSMLICHDITVFSARSQANRGVLRSKWADQIISEVPYGPNTGVFHLIHWLNNVNQGKTFRNSLTNLIDGGSIWGISTFKTTVEPDSNDMRRIEQWTARYTGPTMDLYVHI
jgi:hypothetical protein